MPGKPGTLNISTKMSNLFFSIAGVEFLNTTSCIYQHLLTGIEGMRFT